MKRPKILGSDRVRQRRSVKLARTSPAPIKGTWDQFFSLLREFEFSEQLERNQPDSSSDAKKLWGTRCK
ncbi:MAG: hypothetical protein V4484_09825 [Pseudomonadota bacterium]